MKIKKTSPLWKENWNLPTEDCFHMAGTACGYCNPQIFNPTPAQAKQYSTQALSIKILEAKEAYYAGNPIMQDKDFDAIEASLRAINPKAKVLNKVGS